MLNTRPAPHFGESHYPTILRRVKQSLELQIFGVYVCGTVFGYLMRWPERAFSVPLACLSDFLRSVCLEHAPQAEVELQRCLSILDLLTEIWPMSSCWHGNLLDSLSQARASEADASFRITALLEQSKDKIVSFLAHYL